MAPNTLAPGNSLCKIRTDIFSGSLRISEFAKRNNIAANGVREIERLIRKLELDKEILAEQDENGDPE